MATNQSHDHTTSLSIIRIRSRRGSPLRYPRGNIECGSAIVTGLAVRGERVSATRDCSSRWDVKRTSLLISAELLADAISSFLRSASGILQPRSQSGWVPMFSRVRSSSFIPGALNRHSRNSFKPRASRRGTRSSRKTGDLGMGSSGAAPERPLGWRK